MTKIIRTHVGKAVGDAHNKSVTIVIERRVKHPLLGKIVKKFNKFHAHDENNQCKSGDMVTITESKPISKSKFWVVQSIVEKA